DVANGAPLLSLIPTLTESRLQELDRHSDELLRWFVETTEPGVCAHAMTTALSLPMAMTLDRLKLWDRWIDQVRPSDVTVNVHGALGVTKDPHAVRALTAVLGDRKDMTDEQRTADQKKHAGDVHAELAGKPTVQSLLEAIARQGTIGTDGPKLYKELERL